MNTEQGITIKHLRVEGVLLPILSDWSIAENGRSYVGEAGLLDPRVCESISAIDDKRIECAKEELSAYDALVQLVELKDHICMFCKYKKNECTLLTYSIVVSGNRELTAVYVIQPGFENIADAIHSSLANNEQGAQ
jgi:hypothetical protein